MTEIIKALGLDFVAVPETQGCEGCAGNGPGGRMTELCRALPTNCSTKQVIYVAAPERKGELLTEDPDHGDSLDTPESHAVEPRHKAWAAYEASRAAVLSQDLRGPRVPVAEVMGDREKYTPAPIPHKPVHGGYPLTSRVTMAQHKAEYRGQARATDPQTSHDAASSVGGGKLVDLVFTVLQEKEQRMHDGYNFLPHDKGMTGKEIAAATGRALNSITPRFAQLRRKGLIYAAAKKDKQIVWRVGNGVSL